MNRRDVIKSLGLISLHAFYPSVLAGFLSSCETGKDSEKHYIFFDREEQVFIKDIIDSILPRTATKSASETGVHYFLDDVFSNCLNEDQKELIKEGLSKIKEAWKIEEDHNKTLNILDEKAYRGDENFAWFKIIKQYTLIGFFTGREGTTKAGDYQKVPDGFVGEIIIDPTTHAHSKTSLKFYL
jgi:hypothetical protein